MHTHVNVHTCRCVQVDMWVRRLIPGVSFHHWYLMRHLWSFLAGICHQIKISLTSSFQCRVFPGHRWGVARLQNTFLWSINWEARTLAWWGSFLCCLHIPSTSLTFHSIQRRHHASFTFWTAPWERWSGFMDPIALFHFLMMRDSVFRIICGTQFTWFQFCWQHPKYHN